MTEPAEAVDNQNERGRDGSGYIHYLTEGNGKCALGALVAVFVICEIFFDGTHIWLMVW